MRKVTQESVRAFLQHKNGKFGGISNYNGRQNTEVKDDTLYLFGNAIAKWENDRIYFRLAGWTSPTTTERLSGLGLPISIRKGVANIRGQEIDTYAWYPLDKFVAV
jgi:hypothetical protein